VVSSFLSSHRLDYFAAYLSIAVRVLLVPDRQSDSRIPLYVLELLAEYLGVDKEPLAVGPSPYVVVLQITIRHDRGYRREVSSLGQL
jgi:hypothetical protein